MIVAGKCPPEPDKLKSAKERGFDKIEVYLQKKHLDKFQETSRALEESDVEVVSIHTPHVHLDNKGYMVLADQLAQQFGAYLVFHSQYMHHTHIPELEKLEIESDYGYENNPGAAKTFIQNAILDKNHEMVLDTAHFYLGDHTPEDMEKFLKKNIEQINLVHLCDSSEVKDGLGFGEGKMQIERICQIINQSDFDGIVVLEVMPDQQKEAFEKWKKFTS
jgi:sugar phosphate isomerase/epimerase